MKTENKGICLWSVLALAAAALGAGLYAAACQNISFFPFFAVTTLISLFLPPLAKRFRVRKEKKGAVLEILAIVTAGLDFYMLIFRYPQVPMVVGFMGWIFCAFAYIVMKDHKND